MKNAPENPLAILFNGDAEKVRLVNKTIVQVHVRALPVRYLLRVIETYGEPSQFIELCCYLRSSAKKYTTNFPEIPPPKGFIPVPPNWADNLDDASRKLLFDKADKLNFDRAVAHAREMIASKKKIAPIQEQTMEQVVPLVEMVMEPLLVKVFAKLERSLISRQSAASSSAAAEKQS